MRIHGRSGIAYLSLNSGNDASPMAFLSDWSIQATRTLFDTTSILDTQQIYTVGSTDVSGTFAGFYDTATAQSYTAAADGLPRNMYLYPSTATGQFFSGMVLPDYDIGSGTGVAVSLSVTWAVVGAFSKSASSLGYGATYAATYT